MKINWSNYQENIFQALKNESGNIIINAVAGSGKSSTIVEGMKYVTGTSAFVAFNKAIATELAGRVKADFVGTTHSLGLMACRSLGKIRVDVSKNWKNVDEYKIEKWEKFQICKWVGMVKNTMTNVEDEKEAIKVALQFGCEDVIGHYGIMREVFKKGMSNLLSLDFDDMLYLPAIGKVSLPQFDNLFCDEAQDFNACQLEIAKRAGKRVIAVGDESQSIYGFRGADSDAMGKLAQALKMRPLPLSISYRCPASHIALAQRIVPTIEASPTAKQGEIIDIPISEVNEYCENGTLVICRTNAPIVGVCLSLLSQGKKATIRGKDLGKQLANIIKKIPVELTVELVGKLQEWHRLEYAKLEAKNARPETLSLLDDKLACLLAFCDDCTNKTEVLTKIDRIFSDDATTGTILSTVHRAKGLESEKVVLLMPELFEAFGKTEEESKQEKNIHYVALTRSKQTLIFARGK